MKQPSSCPRCGSANIVLNRIVLGAHGYFVSCEDCGFCGRTKLFQQSAWAAWEKELDTDMCQKILSGLFQDITEKDVLDSLRRHEAEKRKILMEKKTVVFDFDGVIHSYLSGWKGAAVISDPPVPGIRNEMQRIQDAGYYVVVVSTRCASTDGRLAVEQYLVDNDVPFDEVMATKPPAIVYIDDRAICFTGDSTGLLEKINGFKPWNKE